jgi:hypothetical protein
VLLQNKIATFKGILLIHKVNNLLVIYLNYDVIALSNDVLVEPSVRRYKLIVNFTKL